MVAIGYICIFYKRASLDCFSSASEYSSLCLALRRPHNDLVENYLIVAPVGPLLILASHILQIAISFALKLVYKEVVIQR